MEFPIRELCFLAAAIFGANFKRIFGLCQKPLKYKHKWEYIIVDGETQREFALIAEGSKRAIAVAGFLNFLKLSGGKTARETLSKHPDSTEVKG